MSISLIIDYLEHQEKQPNHCSIESWVNDVGLVSGDAEARALLKWVDSLGSADTSTAINAALAIAYSLRNRLIDEYEQKALDWQRDAR